MPCSPMRNLLWLCLIFSACLPDRNLEIRPLPPMPPVNPSDSTKGLRINEILSTGSPDWVEIYNSGTKPVTIKSNSWYFSDDLAEPKKFTFPLDYVIGAGSFLVVACSTGISPSTPAEPRAGFSLSSAGEKIGLSRLQADTVLWIDSVSFPAIPSGQSYGRSPDGGPVFKIFSTPSKGAANP